MNIWAQEASGKGKARAGARATKLKIIGAQCPIIPKYIIMVGVYLLDGYSMGTAPKTV